MPEPQAWTVDFMREEALTLAGPYSPGSEPFSALWRAADALKEVSAAIRRHAARDAAGGLVMGVIGQDGQVRLYGRRPEA